MGIVIFTIFVLILLILIPFLLTQKEEKETTFKTSIDSETGEEKKHQDDMKMVSLQEERTKNEEISKFFKGERIKPVLDIINKTEKIPNKIEIFSDRVDLHFSGRNDCVVFVNYGFEDFGHYSCMTIDETTYGHKWYKNNDLYFFAAAINKHLHNSFDIQEISDNQISGMGTDQFEINSVLLRVEMKRPLSKY